MGYCFSSRYFLFLTPVCSNWCPQIPVKQKNPLCSKLQVQIIGIWVLLTVLFLRLVISVQAWGFKRRASTLKIPKKWDFDHFAKLQRFTKICSLNGTVLSWSSCTSMAFVSKLVTCLYKLGHSKYRVSTSKVFTVQCQQYTVLLYCPYLKCGTLTTNTQ